MSKALLLLLFLINGVVSVFAPWIGVVVAYVIAVLAPQDIWWWNFVGIRPFFLVIIPTLIGFAIAFLRGRLWVDGLKSTISGSMMVMWLSLAISYFFGPYVHVHNQYRIYSSTGTFITLSYIYLTYAIAAALISDCRKLKVASLVVVVSVVYLTFWANDQYYVHHVYGRMHGPRGLVGGGIYYDQNNFAMLFVVGAPFVYFLAEYLERRVIKWISWVLVLLSWNAIFLTASRGALVGTGAVLGTFVLRSGKKVIGLVMLACFLAAYVLEGGTTMKDRAVTIGDVRNTQSPDVRSADDRLEAWRAAIGMIEAHPLTGVGPGSFTQAFPYFSRHKPRVAHNTFFQIASEWGLIAGLAYLYVVLSTVNRLRKNGHQLRMQRNNGNFRFYYAINEACYFGLIGFFTCSMFLTLDRYEVFYYVLVLANATLILGTRSLQRADGGSTIVGMD